VAIFFGYFLYKEFVRKIGKENSVLSIQITMYFCNQSSSLFHNEKIGKKKNGLGLKKKILRNSSKRRKEKEKKKKRYGKEREEGEERRPLPSSRLNYAARS